MKNSIIVLLCLIIGILFGHFMPENIVNLCTDLPHWLLYLLILQVGLNLGANSDLSSIIHSIRVSDFFIPLFTIAGTLLFTAMASLLLNSWTVRDCMAVGSGFAYYSLSSVLIVQLKEASIGIDMASQLGAIALLANMIREMLAIMGMPFYSRFGKLVPVSVAGITSMDLCLPSITRYAGKDMIPVAIVHGLILEISVPLLVTITLQLIFILSTHKYFFVGEYTHIHLRNAWSVAAPRISYLI